MYYLNVFTKNTKKHLVNFKIYLYTYDFFSFHRVIFITFIHVYILSYPFAVRRFGRWARVHEPAVNWIPKRAGVTNEREKEIERESKWYCRPVPGTGTSTTRSARIPYLPCIFSFSRTWIYSSFGAHTRVSHFQIPPNLSPIPTFPIIEGASRIHLQLTNPFSVLYSFCINYTIG